MEWIDSHCHLQSTYSGSDAAIQRARDAGVVAMVCVGTDLATSREAVELAGRHADVHATVGLHPHDASRFEEEWEELVALAAEPGVVGVGEAGFDFHYNHSPVDDQQRAFRAQIRLARELDRVLVIHSRDAWDATFGALQEEGVPPRTVFHCFTGGPDEARRALELGTSLSFSGIVSFRAADDLRAAAALTPLDRTLVETDAPYLAPVPHRGKDNEPAYVAFVGQALAETLQRPVGEIAAATAGNAEALFGPLRAPVEAP